MNQKLLAIGAVFFSVVTPLKATAASFVHEIYSFGDSLVDPGNLFQLTLERRVELGLPAPVPQTPPYAQRLSNGPVWVEFLASDLGLTPALSTSLGLTPPLIPSLGSEFPNDGIHFGFGGASTGTLNTNLPSPTGTLLQIARFQNFLESTPNFQPNNENALYILLAGNNDYAGSRITPRVEDISGPINNTEFALSSLIDLGAQNILVSNLPLLGLTPRFRESPEADDINELIMLHNMALSETLDKWRKKLPDINLVSFDFNAVFENAVSNPADFGLTNVTTPCLTNFSFPFDADFNICSNPDEFLFWDDFHPTTSSHRFVADAALETLREFESVPESTPALSLLALGVLGVGSILKRKIQG
ncbi:MAG: SGNH/GDSL hydrolase family protein [Leptolyngbyaceae cyanobacterium MO_188.B28]|nr:SGNH/GDSL hydrolase family protein [Leptolyngbyaceae cyanobacterium MO_188.B28]